MIRTEREMALAEAWGVLPLVEGESDPGAELVVRLCGVSHPGLEREENEDSYCLEVVTPTPGDPATSVLLVVADGLGGHRAGEVASALARDTVHRMFLDEPLAPADRLASNAVKAANLAVLDAGQATPAYYNMQTTMTTVLLQGGRLTVGHVGDCRLYRLRDGEVEVLTRDHTLAMDLLRMRMISPEQAMDHPGRYQLTRSLGLDPLLRVDQSQAEVRSGDVYLLCSDGLWSEVSSEEIGDALKRERLADACSRLAELVLQRGAPDNLTAVACRVDRAPQAAGKGRGGLWQNLLKWRREGS